MSNLDKAKREYRYADEDRRAAMKAEARHSAGLTQPQAAALVGVHWTTWQRWELDTRTMPQSAWELFCIRTRQQWRLK